MKETIIYSNLLNQTELLRSLSLNGVNSFNYRVYRFNDLLENAHLRLGAFMKGKPLNNQDALFLIESFINNIYSFTSFMDVRHIFNTLREARMNISSNDELKEFQDKVVSKLKANQNIKILDKVYTQYLSTLKDQSSYDDILLARALIVKKEKLYGKIIVLEEETLSPLENELVNVLGNVEKVSLTSLYGKSITKDAKVDAIKAFYGEKSEIDGVLSDIAEHKYPLDNCLIVLAKKDKYVHLLHEDSELYNIPMTFECGLPIHLSSPYGSYQLLKLLKDKYFYDVNGYLRLLKSSCFKAKELFNSQYIDTIANLLGRWKISYDKDTNDKFLTNYHSIKREYLDTFIDKVEHRSFMAKEAEKSALNAIGEFSNGLPYLIENYTNIPNDSMQEFNETALTYILDTIEKSSTLTNKNFVTTYLDEMDDRYLLGKVFSNGAIHVTTIDRALSTIRPHVYFVGLSAPNFPGKPREDYLMNNEAYKFLINVDSKSNERITQKRQFLLSVIDNYKALGADIHLSYSCKNIEEVKDVNPSSVVFEYAHKIGFSLKDSKNSAKQFDNQVSSLRKMSEEFKNHKEIRLNTPYLTQPLDASDLLTKNYSPSVLSTFLKCKLRFYLSRILYADKVREYDALSILRGGTFGDLVHLVMEIYAKHQKEYSSKESFIALANEIFTAYSNFDVPLVSPNDQYTDFIDSCMCAFDIIKDYEIIGAEIKIENQNINGIKFRSSIDVLAKDPSTGDYIIFDYKSARDVEHENNNFEKDIQGIVYAYLLEKEKNIKAKKIVFIYTRFNKTYSYDNPFDITTKEKLDSLINDFTNTITNKNFPIPDLTDNDVEKETCKYCNYAPICHKEDKKK